MAFILRKNMASDLTHVLASVWHGCLIGQHFTDYHVNFSAWRSWHAVTTDIECNLHDRPSDFHIQPAAAWDNTQHSRLTRQCIVRLNTLQFSQGTADTEWQEFPVSHGVQ